MYRFRKLKYMAEYNDQFVLSECICSFSSGLGFVDSLQDLLYSSRKFLHQRIDVYLEDNKIHNLTPDYEFVYFVSAVDASRSNAFIYFDEDHIERSIVKSLVQEVHTK